MEPLKLTDEGVSVGADLGVNVGSEIGLVVAAGNDLGAGENAAVNILRPPMNDKRAKVKEALYSMGNYSEILFINFRWYNCQRYEFFQKNPLKTLKPRIYLNYKRINFYLQFLAKQDKYLTEEK